MSAWQVDLERRIVLDAFLVSLASLDPAVVLASVVEAEGVRLVPDLVAVILPLVTLPTAWRTGRSTCSSSGYDAAGTVRSDEKVLAAYEGVELST